MSFDIFLKKELKELVKSVKGIVLVIVFLFFAMSSPIVAKFTPDILRWAFEATEDILDMSMFMAMMPEPDSIASYTAFFSDFSMMGLIALIIVFGGIVASEKSRGTAAYILTKSISRTEFILSKFVSSVLFIFASLILTAGVLKLYTDLLFNDGLVETRHYILYFALLFLYLVFVMSIVLFASILAKNATGATMLAFVIFIAFSIWGAIPRLGKYAPPNINDISVMLNAKDSTELTVSIILTVAFAVIFLVSGVTLFNRQEL